MPEKAILIVGAVICAALGFTFLLAWVLLQLL